MLPGRMHPASISRTTQGNQQHGSLLLKHLQEQRGTTTGEVAANSTMMRARIRLPKLPSIPPPGRRNARGRMRRSCFSTLRGAASDKTMTKPGSRRDARRATPTSFAMSPPTRAQAYLHSACQSGGEQGRTACRQASSSHQAKKGGAVRSVRTNRIRPERKDRVPRHHARTCAPRSSPGSAGGQ